MRIVQCAGRKQNQLTNSKQRDRKEIKTSIPDVRLQTLHCHSVYPFIVDMHLMIPNTVTAWPAQKSACTVGM